MIKYFKKFVSHKCYIYLKRYHFINKLSIDKASEVFTEMFR